MKKGMSVLMALGFLFAAGFSNAATFNFIDLIDNDIGTVTGTLGSGDSFSGNPDELAFQSFSWTDGGVTLTASATNMTSEGAVMAFAYLDRGNAGLGVCRVISSRGNQCAPSSDDNVTVGERLHYGFNLKVDIDLVDIELRDADHNLYDSIPDGIEVDVDGAGFVQLNSLDALRGQQFVFRTSGNDSQFYISTLNVTAVPEPSTWVLMLLAIAGLMVLRRRV